MHINRYFEQIQNELRKISSIIITETITSDSRSATLGKIKGQLDFVDSSKLYILEIIDTQLPAKISYSYHFQTAQGKLIFRYDNAPHYKKLKTFPHHKHLSEKRVIETTEPSLRDILQEIAGRITQHI